MSHVDGYIFPCYSCGNPAGQMDAAISGLAAAGVKHMPIPQNETRESLAAKSNETLGATYGMLWIDVEGTQYWSTSTSSNVAFLNDMVAEGVKKGISLGIYTSNSQWSPITGGYTGLSKYPLWVSYDMLYPFHGVGIHFFPRLSVGANISIML
jgi:hypothetical protein